VTRLEAPDLDPILDEYIGCHGARRVGSANEEMKVECDIVEVSGLDQGVDPVTNLDVSHSSLWHKFSHPLCHQLG